MKLAIQSLTLWGWVANTLMGTVAVIALIAHGRWVNAILTFVVLCVGVRIAIDSYEDYERERRESEEEVQP